MRFDAALELWHAVQSRQATLSGWVFGYPGLETAFVHLCSHF
jgi:hypothetical protein